MRSDDVVASRTTFVNHAIRVNQVVVSDVGPAALEDVKVPDVADHRGPIAFRRFIAHRRVMRDEMRDSRVVQTPMSGALPVGTPPLGSRHDRRVRIFRRRRLILLAHLYSIGVLWTTWL